MKYIHGVFMIPNPYAYTSTSATEKASTFLMTSRKDPYMVPSQPQRSQISGVVWENPPCRNLRLLIVGRWITPRVAGARNFTMVIYPGHLLRTPENFPRRRFAPTFSIIEKSRENWSYLFIVLPMFTCLFDFHLIVLLYGVDWKLIFSWMKKFKHFYLLENKFSRNWNASVPKQ